MNCNMKPLILQGILLSTGLSLEYWIERLGKSLQHANRVTGSLAIVFARRLIQYGDWNCKKGPLATLCCLFRWPSLIDCKVPKHTVKYTSFVCILNTKMKKVTPKKTTVVLTKRLFQSIDL